MNGGIHLKKHSFFQNPLALLPLLAVVLLLSLVQLLCLAPGLRGRALWLYAVAPRILVFAAAAALLCLYASRIARLQRQVDTDPLTGLASKALLERRLSEVYPAIACVGVLYFDVDGLKNINDHGGHAAGDRLLCAMADALRTAIPPNADCYRIGGDEFLVVVPHAAEADLQDILRAWEQCAPISACVGTASGAGRQLRESIDRADRAMYRKKQRAPQPADL